MASALRLSLAALALTLGGHSLIMSWWLPSGLCLVVFYCWLLVAGAAMLDRLDDIKAMSAIMALLLISVTVANFLSADDSADAAAFKWLALFPATVCWICTYSFVRHIEKIGRADVADTYI